MTDPPICIVSAAELRRMFNEQDFWGRAERGELMQSLMADSHPSSPRANLPICTRSQMVAYFDKGVKVALVHQYLRPDGTLGASGRPDPKRLLLGGAAYRFSSQTFQKCMKGPGR